MNFAEFKVEVERLGFDISTKQLVQLEAFYKILVETNKTMNLTRIIKKEDVYLKHFYDSLTIAKIYDLNDARTLCDIGTGAGFPGIVLKIFYPNLKVVLIDALQKRITYLNRVIDELGLENIEARHIRAEELTRENVVFDVVTARAVAPLSKLLPWAMPLVSPTGVFIAMKASVDDEIVDAKKIIKKKHYTIEKRVSFLLPKEESKRNLLLITKEK